ncbi:hypothetical protein K1719_017382 [Acacia pycnantha]|nr:hypothetical protein K1719_017382 [Acacia pycnantha]
MDRLPDVPFEFYNVESLRRIGLHQVCFRCGKYGHKKESCLVEQEEDQGKKEGVKEDASMETPEGELNDNGKAKKGKAAVREQWFAEDEVKAEIWVTINDRKVDVASNKVNQFGVGPSPRGTGTRSFTSLIRDMRTHYHLDFIAILKLAPARAIVADVLNPQDFEQWSLMDCEGYKRRNLCLWDHSISSFVLERHHQFYTWRLPVRWAFWTMTISRMRLRLVVGAGHVGPPLTRQLLDSRAWLVGET